MSCPIPRPAPLETVRAFVNTLDIDDGIELLAAPAELAAWLAEQDLLGGGARTLRATAADLRRAIELREALRAHLLAHHDQPLARRRGRRRSTRRRAARA